MEQIDPDEAVVVSADLGWSDVGAWEALKEVLQKEKKDNVTKGSVILRNSSDSLVYSYTNQFVTGIDLKGMIVVVTKDVVLICPQESIPEIKKQLKELKGTNFEKYS